MLEILVNRIDRGLEVIGHDRYIAAGEPSRRGGSAAGVVRPARSG